MADYTDIGDSLIEVGKPIRALDGRALRDNPIAIAEGAADAPRVARKSIAPLISVTGNFVFDLTGYQGFTAHIFGTNATGIQQNIQIAASDDGITYGTATTIMSIPGNTDATGMLFCDFSSGSVKYAHMLGMPSTGASGAGVLTLNNLSGSTTRIRMTNGSITSGVMLIAHGGEATT